MSRTFDLLICGGEVIDGSAGAVPTRADIGVIDGRIAALGEVSDAQAPTRIDATGRVVTPGFIDAHVHSELALLHGAAEDRHGSVLQGVTTHATGADGFGWAPIPTGVPARDAGSLWRSTSFAYGSPDLQPAWPTVIGYLSRFEGATPVNIAPFAPHQAIRFGVLGWETRAPDAAEMAAMKLALGEWLEVGAVGLATGLDYQPACSASTEEIIELARMSADAGGVYAPHQRNRQRGRVGAWQESIRIGRETGVPVTVAHEFVDAVTRPVLEEARDVDLTFDWYLYPAGSTHLLAMLPVEDYAGGTDGVLERLRDPAERSRIGAILERELLEDDPGSFAYFSATRSGRHIGQTIPDIAADQGLTIAEAAVRLLEEELPAALLVYRRGIGGDAFAVEVTGTVRDPRWSLASDGIYHGMRPHPRGFGCFARLLRVGVREMGVLTLGDAIHRMSGAPADRLRIRDRGRIREGLAADLVVLDPATVSDRATWEEPRLPPVGIDAVLVNGVTVVADGRPTGALPGRLVGRST